MYALSSRNSNPFDVLIVFALLVWCTELQFVSRESFEGPGRYSGDESLPENEKYENQRQGAHEACGHDLAPEDIALGAEEPRDIQGNGVHVQPAHCDERPGEIVPDVHEDNQPDDEETGFNHGKGDHPVDAEIPASIHAGGIEDFIRHVAHV